MTTPLEQIRDRVRAPMVAADHNQVLDALVQARKDIRDLLCCGRGVRTRANGDDPMWCGRCEGHIAKPLVAGTPPWDRTYEVHGEPCPFQVVA